MTVASPLVGDERVDHGLVGNELVGDEPESAPPTRGDATETLTVFVPVSRGRALVRAALLFAFGAALAVVSLLVIRGLKFTPSAVSNRIEDYALACLMIPMGIAALWLTWRGTAWLLLAAWPGRLDMEATDAALTFRLGPFGCSVYDARRLDVKYPYELSADEESAPFEMFVPEEEQIKNFLPQITHPDTRGSIRLEILKFAKETEPNIARQLRPLITRWRGRPNASERQPDEGG